ncbi:hypothetical protein EVAR_35460_1 [Eumeta japonica]|uniref:Shavenoid isoform B-like N-terminal domain-containing protein n=1 Tax=Eumeta variegata TaxID=151549 RepID=A0A4C1XPI9_EUMVA|nr:hypothetical protein EVAR_35460_1 [Eumeta japonica]
MYSGRCARATTYVTVQSNRVLYSTRITYSFGMSISRSVCLSIRGLAQRLLVVERCNGTDCGLTRCMEMSHGTAIGATLRSGNWGCVCQCHSDLPAFREDQRICVNNIEECPMATFGRGSTKPQIPFVFLPLKGQIVYPSKEIVFTDIQEAVCAVTSAQYLSPSGWTVLRDVQDNDVPFGLYRDEGKTFLQPREYYNTMEIGRGEFCREAHIKWIQFVQNGVQTKGGY